MPDNDPPAVAAIIPAAGFGTRMGADIPKQFLELAGAPILVRTLRVFLAHPDIHIIMVVLPPEHLQSAQQLLLSFLHHSQQRHIQCISGGDSRQQSVRNGLKALPASIERILVHDGARPMVTAAIIDRCLTGIDEHGAVIAAVPVKDTLKEVGAGRVVGTVDRARLHQAQTPQGMERHLLERAYEQADSTGFIGTDEASLLEHAGIPVSVVMGGEENIKITRPEDLKVAAALLLQQDRRDRAGGGTMRIGHGFDAHRLVEGRRLILGGEEIPYHLGLAGHSDADVLVHALMDALLGALGAGDIGRHFPDTDEQYRGADSLRLLESVIQLVKEKNMRLVNADITVVCQQPKLAPCLAAMKSNLGTACATSPENINIKATTTEKMGYTGRGEGIAAHAAVLLTGTA